MLSYSEYKLREANEPPAPQAGGTAGAMPDPVSGMPPGGGESSPPPDIGGLGAGGGMSMGGPPGGMGDLGGGMPGGMPGGVGGDQKPTPLNLNASNFWDVLEKMFKKSKKETK